MTPFRSLVSILAGTLALTLSSTVLRAEPGDAGESHAQKLSIESRFLSEAPAISPADPGLWFSEGVKALYYDGPSYKGKPTKVFAYYGLPAGLKKGEKVPAMVLVHGGGGTAFAEWVRLWNSRGYAAISMDLCGCIPVKNPDGKGWVKIPSLGEPAGWDDSFNHLNEPIEDQWPYYAVNAIARARTFIGAQAGVDSSRIGVTGISWGGYLTCLTAGLDSRYLFAVPVYGCGFLRDYGSAWSAKLKSQGMEPWTLQFDPSVYMADAKMPMLWVTGTNDFAYPMEALKRTSQLVKAPVSLCVTIRMPHGHGGAGERPEEILAFADSFCKGGQALPSFTEQGAASGEAWASFKSPDAIASAELIFTKDVGANKERKWESVPANLDLSAGRVSASLPEGVKMYYFNIHDARKLTVSSQNVEIQ